MADERFKGDANFRAGGVVGGYSSADSIGEQSPTLIALRIDPTTGRLLIDSNAGGTAYTEDVATANPQVGSAIMIERDDVLATVTPVEGDWIGLRGTAEGALWTQDFNSDAILADTANMDTNLGTIAGAVAGSEMQVDVITSALPTGAATAAKQLADGHNVTVDNASIAVTGTFWQGTQPVSGTFWQATQPISGTVTANAGTNLNTSALLTETTFTGRVGEVQASPTANTVLARLKTIADQQLADSHNVTVDNASLAVTGTFWQATQPISGTVTADAGTNLNTSALALDSNWVADGGAYGKGILIQGDDGTNRKNINVDATTGDVQVDVTNSVAVTGTFWQATQPVSAASLPLPSGASTAANQQTDALTDTELRATAVPVSGTFWQATQPVSGTFWQTTQPISAASLPLPTGAATSANQLADGHNVTVDNAVGAGVYIRPGTGINLDTSAVTISAALPTGSNAIGKLAANSGVDIGDVSLNSVWQSDTASDWKYADINDAVSGNNTIITATVGKQIAVWAILIVSDGTTDVRWEDGAAGTAFTGQVPLQAREGYSISAGGVTPLFTGTANTLLNLELTAAINVHGFVSYTLV